jgi:hypothetical protein
MDASYLFLLHAPRKMELRIGEVLDERGATRTLRSAGYATVGTAIFNREPCYIEIDEAPVFDAYTDYLGVEPVYDTSFANLDDGPIFDTEFTVFDQEPDDITTMCSSVVNDAEYVAHEEPVFHDGPLFDEESAIYDTEPVLDVPQQQPNVLSTACINFVFDHKPVFDEEPFHDLTTTSSIDDFHPNTNMVNLDVACSPVALFLPSSTSTIVDESVLFPDRIAAPLSIPDIKHSDVEVGAVGINRRLFCRSTVGDEHLREDHEAMELESWFALRTT